MPESCYQINLNGLSQETVQMLMDGVAALGLADSPAHIT